jgi:pimeloyl-ACP methyl ester carboxylesterase
MAHLAATAPPETFEVTIAGLSVRARSSGAGPLLVILGHDFGSPGWTQLFDELSLSYRVVVPDIPGFDGSEQPVWARDVRDLAILIGRWLDRLDGGAASVIGCGFGGWVAAELATMSPASIDRLVLVGPAGLLPQDGRIRDQMLISHNAYVRASFADPGAYAGLYGEDPTDDTLLTWDVNREMVSRVTWKPYMYNRRLEPLLAEVRHPVLVVWGSDDAVVPIECAHRYVAGLPDARLHIVDGCGHAVDLERPAELAALVRSHVPAAVTELR